MCRTTEKADGLVTTQLGMPTPVSLTNAYSHTTASHRNSWCDPFKTWQKSYSFDPTANLTAAEAKLVIGGA